MGSNSSEGSLPFPWIDSSSQLLVTSRYDQPQSSSKSSIQLSIGGTGPYSCNLCGAKYSRRQEVLRHRRDKHELPNLCHFCDFRWRRPYLYRKHLERRHPKVDPHIILSGARDKQNSTRKLCMYCDVVWNHPDQYKNHLREHHPNLDPDAVLGKVPGSQRRDKIIARPYKAPAQLARARKVAVSFGELSQQLARSPGSLETKQDEMSEGGDLESDSG